MFANPPHPSYFQSIWDGYPAVPAYSGSAPIDGDGGTPAIHSLDSTLRLLPPSNSGALSEDSFVGEFIPSTRDAYDNMLSVVWYLSPISSTDPFEGARIVNQYSSDSRALGIVRELVAQDATHVLYRLRIERWIVRGRTYEPPCDTYSFLLAPAKTPNRQMSPPTASLMCSHRTGRIIHRIHDIAQEVKTLAVYGNPMVLMGPDDVTNAFAIAHAECHLMRAFSSDKDTGVAVHESDLLLGIGHCMAVPIPNDDSRVVEVNSLTGSAYSEDGSYWGQNGDGQHSGEVTAERTASCTTFGLLQDTYSTARIGV
ncbi:hypothetical protein PENSPDRAFT_688959 [Peniophora sp. CONT]|nr:hypothetical protein PENSPDRAFT_688959 [Peniophora sp. CONT]